MRGVDKVTNERACTTVAIVKCYLSVRGQVFAAAVTGAAAREWSLRGIPLTGHRPKAGVSLLPSHRGGPGWRRPPATSDSS